MSKIPEWAVKMAEDLPIQGDGFCDDDDIQTIALAISEAYTRGQRECEASRSDLIVALSEGLDLCERARKMDAMEKERAEMYLRNPEITRSATIPIWAEEQYQRDLSAWEDKAKRLMPRPFAPTTIRSLQDEEWE